MKNPPAILGKIAESTIKRVAKAKEALSPEQIYEKVHILNNKLSFRKALAAPGLSFICEVKKASPSKGIISQDFPWMEIAKDYEESGAAAISVLTEPEFFLGSDQYLREISAAVKIPTLRKDFIIDPYQIYEAKLWGAGAALLICALLEQETLSSYLQTAEEIDLDCLVEVHNEEELEEALASRAKIIGINNRDLTTFNVDTSLTSRLRKKIPSDIIAVAESGIKDAGDIRRLKDDGIDAVLIGESLMRRADRKDFLKELLSV
ncbi:MAG: indole-3-glycerol phosphate synthase TrpC [Treponema sp.]|nr:indole-3-glycerol phosphate synthase TrpC [Treponema sp.]